MATAEAVGTGTDIGGTAWYHHGMSATNVTAVAQQPSGDLERCQGSPTEALA